MRYQPASRPENHAVPTRTYLRANTLKEVTAFAGGLYEPLNNAHS